MTIVYWLLNSEVKYRRSSCRTTARPWQSHSHWSNVGEPARQYRVSQAFSASVCLYHGENLSPLLPPSDGCQSRAHLIVPHSCSIQRAPWRLRFPRDPISPVRSETHGADLLIAPECQTMGFFGGTGRSGGWRERTTARGQLKAFTNHWESESLSLRDLCFIYCNNAMREAWGYDLRLTRHRL
jgi:hypothetical protein